MFSEKKDQTKRGFPIKMENNTGLGVGSAVARSSLCQSLSLEGQLCSSQFTLRDTCSGLTLTL